LLAQPGQTKSNPLEESRGSGPDAKDLGDVDL
jgi:hypothetical protein